ncbi:hypothetical protein FRC09_014018 [Ceratobasidium sp. 395]|nr:hypothetical protein FRC09_014018 [Ceratobasidium sp. 395]
MFNSVEFVLMFLSIFSSVTEENIKAVMFLLGLAFQYDTIDLWAMMTQYGLYAQVLTMVGPLSALAECSGYDMTDVDKQDLSVTEAYEMLRAIMDPIMGQLDLAEMEQIRYTAMSGGEILDLPPARLGVLVQNWTRHARDDEEKYGRFGKLVAAKNTGRASGIGSADADGTPAKQAGSRPKRRMPGPDEAVKEGPDHRPQDEKLDAWSNMKMDDSTAATIVAFCKRYAAASTETTVKRSGRVKKRQLAGWNHAFYATPGWPQGWGVQPTREELGLQSSESESTDSGEVCIGSGHTPTARTKLYNGYEAWWKKRDSGRKQSENGTGVDGRGNMEHKAEGTGTAEDKAGGLSELDRRRGLDMTVSTSTSWYNVGYAESGSQVDSDDESMDQYGTGEATGTGTSGTEEYMDTNTSPYTANYSYNMTKSTSWDTLVIRMYCPPLVGYYMRQEEYRTKNPKPRLAPSTPSTPPRSPIPGMSLEQIYDGYSNSWDVEQNSTWCQALHDPARQYVNEAFPDLDEEMDLDSETEPEPKVETKSNVVGKIVEVVGFKLGRLFKY